MDLERERGITIKAQSVTFKLSSQDGENIPIKLYRYIMARTSLMKYRVLCPACEGHC